MMPCKCYHAERNFIGKIGVCWGTKKCEACSCGGDESKCDFYEDKRKKATPKTTNADRIRVMSDEELAKGLAEISDCVACETMSDMKRRCHHEFFSCWQAWLDWLKKEATT